MSKWLFEDSHHKQVGDSFVKQTDERVVISYFKPISWSSNTTLISYVFCNYFTDTFVNVSMNATGGTDVSMERILHNVKMVKLLSLITYTFCFKQFFTSWYILHSF